MTNENQAAPQPVDPPQPAQPQAAPQPPDIQYVPAIRGVTNYFSIGATPQGHQQLYTFDIVLNQWRIMNANEMQQIMIAQGVPNNVIDTLRRMGMSI